MSWLFPSTTTIIGSPITIGTTTELPPGSNASVTNTGTAYAPILNFGIPVIANVEGTITGAISTVVISNLAPSIVVVTNAGGKLANSSVTTTELGHLGGTTSNVQAQLNAKQGNITGAAQTIAVSNLTASCVMVTDVNGQASNNSITVTQLQSLANISGDIQAQFSGKQATVTGAATTVTSANLAANVVVVTNAGGKLSNNAVTVTQLQSLANVTGDVQAQLAGKRNVYPALVDVQTVSNLPAPVANVITLIDNASYRIIGNVDLLGARLVMGNNTSLIGQAPYYSQLSSTGISNTVPMITAAQGFQIDSMVLTAPTIFSLNGNVASSQFSFWRTTFNANRQIGNVGNALLISMNTCTTTGSGNITFQNAIYATTIQSCVMKGLGANAAMFYLDPSLNLTGRMRMFMNNFNPGAGGTGIVVANSNSIVLPEGLWLDSNSFEDGVFQAISGIDPTTSEKVISFNNINLASSLSAGQTYLTTPSTVFTPNTGTYYKLSGTYALTSNSQRFASDGAGRLTFTGNIGVKAQVIASITFATSKNNDVCAFGIYDSSRGNIAIESVQAMTAGTSSQYQSVGVSYLASMVQGNYLEVWGRDMSTNNGNIILQNVNFQITGM